MGWRVCQGPKSLPLLGFWLAASDQLDGQSLWGKKSWEKLLWRIPCKISLLRYFHRRSSSSSWELLEVTALSSLAPAWAALWPCSCRAGTPLMGALTLPRALNFPSEPQACLFTWALLLPAVVSLCLPGWAGALVQQWSCAAAENDGWFLHCCRRIKSAGIIEDDIPGSLGIQTQPLPAREQLLPKIMNTHHGIHQHQDSERTEEQSLCCS